MRNSPDSHMRQARPVPLDSRHRTPIVVAVAYLTQALHGAGTAGPGISLAPESRLMSCGI